ncbi:hypothetical protein Tsubulata_009174 [Turnera subulata]|uniref:Pectin acetylesterase n=1 Tax=Turnera subulata TaxID=218843 RepID=A0A9Q0J761_9ROSI|nr:hypothetical protein Tsubulata_009174 [Turnera subulata]
MGDSRLPCFNILTCSLLLLLRTQALYVGITYVTNAVAKGAVCLDGSPPAYHLHKGFGTGINSWLVHFEGGGWCNNVTSCLSRKNTHLGSSKRMGQQIAFSGILSNQKQFNPDFYNWNRVKIRYCDGSSFTGDVQEVNRATKLYFRGARVWLTVVQDLLAKGMKNAENVRLYFLDVQLVDWLPFCTVIASVLCYLWGSAKNLPASCTSRLKPALIKNILAPGVADPRGSWNSCKLNINKCSTVQLKIIQDFRLQFLASLFRSSNSSSRGLYIDSCFAHCQTETQETWLFSDSPVLKGTTKRLCIINGCKFGSDASGCITSTAINGNDMIRKRQ